MLDFLVRIRGSGVGYTAADTGFVTEQSGVSAPPADAVLASVIAALEPGIGPACPERAGAEGLGGRLAGLVLSAAGPRDPVRAARQYVARDLRRWLVRERDACTGLCR
jgi:hypothetical protein